MSLINARHNLGRTAANIHDYALIIVAICPRSLSTFHNKHSDDHCGNNKGEGDDTNRSNADRVRKKIA